MAAAKDLRRLSYLLFVVVHALATSAGIYLLAGLSLAAADGEAIVLPWWLTGYGIFLCILGFPTSLVVMLLFATDPTGAGFSMAFLNSCAVVNSVLLVISLRSYVWLLKGFFALALGSVVFAVSVVVPSMWSQSASTYWLSGSAIAAGIGFVALWAYRGWAGIVGTQSSRNREGALR